MSLKKRALAGVRWTGFSTALIAALQFIQIAVLARLLLPEDFGLMALVVVVQGFALNYADMGMSNAIIHRQETTRDQLSTLYWVNLLAGLVIYAVVIAVTPALLIVFDEPRLGDLIPVAALVFLIAPLGQQFEVLLKKNLRFKELALCESAATLLGVAVAIGAALAGHGVFSLIFGQLSSAVFKTACLVAIGLRHWRPHLHFQLRDTRGYLSFGLFQMGEGTVNFLNERLDQIVIGMLLGAEALGYYSLAYSLVALPVSRINPILTRVAFPVLARVQDEPEKLKVGFMTMREVLAAINFPLLLGIFVVAPVFVPLIVGEQWLPSVVLIQILALAAMMRSVGNPVGSLLLACGRPDLGLYVNCALAPVLLAAIVLGATSGGVVGAAVGLLVTVLMFFAVGYIFLVRRLLGPCLRPYLGSVAPAAVTASLMAVAVAGLAWLVPLDSYPLLVAQVLFGGMLYVALNWMIYRKRSLAIVRLALGRGA